MNDKRAREPRSELTSIGFLSPLAFGASFEELANFLIDHVVDAEPGLSSPPVAMHFLLTMALMNSDWRYRTVTSITH